ncbi:tetratricopeptide repeat protein [Sulfurihydrogenibium subterraneum]|uniref:tetratricopeptide repeat protein n=1 Tax=Sulfurihydrogenibium subterraneum TaxID=171121 RepID=UPI0004908687|nr:tetratricopeptide repeat protein [Sulfurihydrogenibium subterraneum]
MSSRIEALIKALEKDPNNPLGLYGLALEFYKEGRYEDAIVYFKKYLSVYDDQGAAYRTLAQAYVNIGDIEQAIETYERGIEQARKYNHPTMVEEFKQEIERLKSLL